MVLRGARTLALALLVALATGRPLAAAADTPVDPDADDLDDLWGYLLEPHAEAVAVLVDQGRAALGPAAEAVDAPHVATLRADALREARGVVERIRALDPHAPALDYLRGAIAEVSGRTTTAEALLARYLERAPTGPLVADALVRLGRIALTRRDPATAIPRLREAVAAQRTREGRVRALLHLAAALDAAGDVEGAIALLSGEIARGVGPAENDDTALWLALIATYDRDDQPSAALVLIGQLKAVFGTDYLSRLWMAHRAHPPALVATLWYERALALETDEQLVPARAAWSTYLGLGPTARDRGRARAHLEAIDAALAARRAPPPPPRRRRHP